MRHTFYTTIIIMLLGLLTFPAITLAQNEVYGWELMSDQERAEHRTKMQGMKTEEEKERYRNEHHQKMLERARQQGVTLPDMPRERMRDMDMDGNYGGGRGGMMGGQGGGGRR